MPPVRGETLNLAALEKMALICRNSNFCSQQTPAEIFTNSPASPVAPGITCLVPSPFPAIKPFKGTRGRAPDEAYLGHLTMISPLVAT